MAVSEIARFEAWFRERANGRMSEAEIDSLFRLKTDIGGGEVEYSDCGVQSQWEAWQAAIDASDGWRNDSILIHNALDGRRGTDQQRIAETTVRLGAVLLRKNRDYGSSVWKAPRLAPGVDVGKAILVRLSDKIERLENLLAAPGEAEVGESIDETLLDFGGYSILYAARPKEPTGRPGRDALDRLVDVVRRS